MLPSKPFTVLALLALTACEATPAPELPDWEAGYPVDTTTTGTPTTTVTTTDTLAGGLLEMTVELEPVLSRFGQKAAPAAACEIDTSVVPGSFTKLECQLEMNELDLWFHGWNYELKIPKDTCQYLGVENYMYQAWEDGIGPGVVEYEVNEEGLWVADVQNSAGGEAVCQYDYTNPGNPEAPNCCYGSYLETVVTVDGTGVEISRESFIQDWGGGPIGDCYAGAAFTSSATVIDPVNKLPHYLIVDIDERVDNLYQVIFNPPASKPESSTLTVANYYQTADGVPAGLFAPFALDHYAIECLDRAFEITARFEVDVREWDEKAEYLQDGGNPNSGIQAAAGAAAPLESNGSGSPINDFWDWADFALNGIDYVQSWD